MLELPEAFVISKQLKDELLGDVITGVVVNQSPHKFAWYFENPQVYESRLRGLTLTDVVPLAGQVEMQFEDMRHRKGIDFFCSNVWWAHGFLRR